MTIQKFAIYSFYLCFICDFNQLWIVQILHLHTPTRPIRLIIATAKYEANKIIMRKLFFILFLCRDTRLQFLFHLCFRFCYHFAFFSILFFYLCREQRCSTSFKLTVFSWIVVLGKSSNFEWYCNDLTNSCEHRHYE